MDRKREQPNRKPERKLRPMEAPSDAQGGTVIDPKAPGAAALHRRLSDRRPPAGPSGRSRAPGTVEK